MVFCPSSSSSSLSGAKVLLLLAVATWFAGCYGQLNSAMASGDSSANWRPPDRGLVIRNRNETRARMHAKRYLPTTDVKTTVCSPISEPVCQTSLYNLTLLPNEWGHQNQAEASAQIKKFNWILKSKCSALLPIFMCIFFFPVCTEKAIVFPYTEMLIISKPPCTEMCTAVRQECHSWLDQNGFDWPTAFSCDKLPPKDGEHECFFPSSSTSALQASKQALRNMVAAGFVPSHVVEHIDHDQIVHEKVIIEGSSPVKGQSKSSHELAIEEPANNLVLLVSISVFISLLVLLSVAIALIRCYFQVCAGTACSYHLRRKLQRSPHRSRRLTCWDRIRLRKLQNEADQPAEIETVGLQDVNASMSESNLVRVKKRPWPAAAEWEEQCRTMSLYDVEEVPLPGAIPYKVTPDHSSSHSQFQSQQLIVATPLGSNRLRPSTSNHWNFPYEDRKADLPPPHNFGFSTGVIGPRRPSVSWKHSTEILNDGKLEVPSQHHHGNKNLVTSASMNFNKSAEILVEGGTLKRSRSPTKPPSSQLHQQLQLSKSQPDLDSMQPVWLQREDAVERPSTMRKSKTITTATVGVGTSPSLASHRAITNSKSLAFDRSTAYNGVASPSVKVSLPAGTPSRNNGNGTIVKSSLVQSKPPSGLNSSASKQATMPTKYTIQLFVDESSARLAPPGQEGSSPVEVISSNGAVSPRCSNSKTLPRQLNATVLSPPDPRNKDTIETERQKHQAIRELFYV